MTRAAERVLIADDEPHIRGLLSELVRGAGLEPLEAADGEEALNVLRHEFPDLMLIDHKMPGLDGMEVLKRSKKLDPSVPVVMLTAYADVPGAVEAMKAGAADYLAKPFQHDDMLASVQRGLKERQVRRQLGDQAPSPSGMSLRERMGPSESVALIVASANLVAGSDFSVLILGETGCGKDLVARAIHEASSRSSRPFVPVDCGAIPESLLESELFGHEKGAFTGAAERRMGRFEAAEGGTLFLDEISNMPLSSQAKLLRVLQEKTLFRVGGSTPVKTDVRLLAASNEDLLVEVAKGKFRKDLFYRIKDFTIQIPPLRDRKEDIVYLAGIFLRATNAELNKAVTGLADEAIGALLAYDWPGNVRELRTTIRRGVLLAGHLVEETHLEMKGTQHDAPGLSETAWDGRSLRDIVRSGAGSLEREVIRQTLLKTGGNKAKAARILQVDYKTLHKKVKDYGLSPIGKET